MTLPAVPRMNRAIRAGDIAEVRKVLGEHPDQLIYRGGGSGTWLHLAAEDGNIPVIDALIEGGIDVNIDSGGSGEADPPLDQAICRGHVAAVRHLIDKGADVNLGRSLFAAIDSPENSLELVKLLVEKGADVNREWFMGDPKKGKTMNPLSFAIAYGKTDIADYLRTHGASTSKAPISRQPTPIVTAEERIEQEVIAYFEQHFGPVHPLSSGEIVPSTSPIRVHVIPASAERNHVTLFTTGMAAASLTVPSEEYDDYRFAELFLQLPANWPYQDVANAKHGWPIHWLRMLANFPHEQQGWLPPVTIVEDDPPGPIAPQSKFTAMLVLAEQSFNSEQGHPVQLYRLTPLYPQEQTLEKNQGIDALLRAFDEQSVPFIVDLKRRNVANGPQWGEVP